jgi:hypothetical protein
MASVLKVDEMQGVTSAGDITITGEGGSATIQLQQGLAKAWMHSDFSSLQDSFNASSLVDTGSGDNGINYTSSMSSANYSVGVKSQPTSGNDTNLNSIVKFNSQTSSAVNGQAGNVAGALFDCPAIYITVHGDLA